MASRLIRKQKLHENRHFTLITKMNMQTTLEIIVTYQIAFTLHLMANQ